MADPASTSASTPTAGPSTGGASSSAQTVAGLSAATSAAASAAVDRVYQEFTHYGADTSPASGSLQDATAAAMAAAAAAAVAVAAGSSSAASPLQPPPQPPSPPSAPSASSAAALTATTPAAAVQAPQQMDALLLAPPTPPPPPPPAPSSAPEHTDVGQQQNGQRPHGRAQRACVNCRKQKMRCTGADENKPCNRCRTHNLECLFEKAPKEVAANQQRELAETIYERIGALERDVSEIRAIAFAIASHLDVRRPLPNPAIVAALAAGEDLFEPINGTNATTAAGGSAGASLEPASASSGRGPITAAGSSTSRRSTAASAAAPSTPSAAQLQAPSSGSQSGLDQDELELIHADFIPPHLTNTSAPPASSPAGPPSKRARIGP